MEKLFLVPLLLFLSLLDSEESVWLRFTNTTNESIIEVDTSLAKNTNEFKFNRRTYIIMS